MSQEVSGEPGAGSDYHVRRFRADDVDAFLALHDEVFGRGQGREWFAWKYEENPYVYHVPIFVAEREGDVVGARPFFALELSVDGGRHVALQPCDTMVHPDHRRRGLLPRMNEVALQAYRDRDVSFVFDFPDGDSGAGDRRLGWERVADHPTYYRVHDAAALERTSAGGWPSLAARGLQPLLDGYNGLSTRRLRPPGDVTVERYDSVPAATLAAIEYDRRRHGIHVHRDLRFYDWRFDDPSREYTAYVAERAGEPIAGVVVGEAAGDAETRLTDVTPLPREEAADGLEALLERVIREHADAALLAAPPVLPDGLARRAGFRRDDRPPLSAVGSTTTHVARGLGEGTVIDGVDVTDPSNWQLSFSERDPA